MSRSQVGRQKSWLVAGAIACTVGFLLLGVLASSDWLTTIETGWIKSVARWRSPLLTNLMQKVSWLGTGGFELPFALLVAGFLWWRRRSGEGRRYFLWGLAGWALYAALKLVYQRPRPSVVERLGGAGWHSFPSGHAMLAPILFVAAAVLVFADPHLQRFRIPALAIAWLASFALAFSRVYLGVHYPSDVVAGLLAGSGCLALSLVFIRPYSPEKISSTD